MREQRGAVEKNGTRGSNNGTFMDGIKLKLERTLLDLITVTQILTSLFTHNTAWFSIFVKK